MASSVGKRRHRLADERNLLVHVASDARAEGHCTGPLSSVRLSPDYYASFVELHIEQGPILEKENLDIGIVTAIAAPAALRVIFTGEGGHFIDTLSWWLDARPVRVHAVSPAAAGDLLVTLEFDDGSVATVAYTTTGHHRFPKETFHAVSGGRIARLDNFRSATLWSGRRPRVQRSRWSIDKGQRHQLERFLEAVRSGGPMPISLTSLVATTRATLAAVRSLATGRPEAV